MNINDIELLVKDGHISKRVGYVLRYQHEQLEAQKQMILKLANMFNRMTDLQMQTMAGSAAMTGRLDSMLGIKREGIEVSSDATLTGSMDEDDPEKPKRE
jgi:hypothetical protein